MCVKKFIWIFAGVLLTQTACDLQPKILSLPDSVGDFISARYPALLADPNVNPEIYNSAATDYGMYASPNLYGVESSDDEYVTYASVDDYIVPPQVSEYSMLESDSGQEIVDSSVATDDYLSVPMYAKAQDKADVKATVEEDILVANKPNVGTQTVTRVAVQEIVVKPGDTLYSISRQYSVPVNDLAVMNKLTTPFMLSVGQKIRVPNLSDAPVVKIQEKTDATKEPIRKTEEKVQEQKQKVAEAKPVKKISSDPSKKLPTIGARSSSKFSWPIRGKILSEYGAKSNGLFNDGINIGAKRGTPIGAAENGVVAYAGNEVKGMGNLVIIQHADGWMTVYAHMDTMNVRRGARVKVGHQIGTVGETGKVDRPQLHFEIRKGTKAYNPSAYMKK